MSVSVTRRLAARLKNAATASGLLPRGMPATQGRSTSAIRAPTMAMRIDEPGRSPIPTAATARTMSPTIPSRWEASRISIAASEMATRAGTPDHRATRAWTALAMPTLAVISGRCVSECSRGAGKRLAALHPAPVAGAGRSAWSGRTAPCDRPPAVRTWLRYGYTHRGSLLRRLSVTPLPAMASPYLNGLVARSEGTSSVLPEYTGSGKRYPRAACANFGRG